MVCGPLEPTHLLPVALQPPLRLQGWGPDVPLQDHAVPAPRRELVSVPGQRPWRPGRGQGRLRPGPPRDHTCPPGDWVAPHRHVPCGLPAWTASSLRPHPRSARSLCACPRPPDSPRTDHTGDGAGMRPRHGDHSLTGLPGSPSPSLLQGLGATSLRVPLGQENTPAWNPQGEQPNTLADTLNICVRPRGAAVSAVEAGGGGGGWSSGNQVWPRVSGEEPHLCNHLYQAGDRQRCRGHSWSLHK